MAKTTKKDKTNGNVTVLERPEPAEPREPEAVPAETEEDETETTFQETAGDEEISKRRGRGHHKEASAGFFARISGYSSAEWEKLLLYIYRLFPITDRKASGEPVTYIAKLNEPIDEEYVLKEPNWGGSGKYRVRLNKTNADGKNTPIDSVEFVVENLKYPPRVPPGEWVDDARNKRWAWAKTYFEGKDKDAAAPVAAAPAAPAGPTIGELIKGVKELKELSKEAAPPPAPAPPDPVVQLNGTIDAVGKILDRAKPAETPAKENTLEKFLLTELTAERAANRDLMSKLLDRANGEVKADPLSTIAIKLLEKRLEKMDEKPEAETAAERQSRMNGTQELVVEISKHFAPVLDHAVQMFTVMAAAKQQQQPQTARRPAATVEVTAQQQQQPQTDAPAADPAAQQEQQPQPQQQPTMEQAQQQILNIVLGQATPTLQQYLETGADEDASAGANFAAWFCDSAFTLPNLPPPFNRISGIDALAFAKQFGKDQILAAYKKNPALYQQIAPNTEAEERFIRFLDEFLGYDPNAEGDD